MLMIRRDFCVRTVLLNVHVHLWLKHQDLFLSSRVDLHYHLCNIEASNIDCIILHVCTILTTSATGDMIIIPYFF